MQNSLNEKHILKSSFAHLVLIGFLNVFLVYNRFNSITQ